MIGQENALFSERIAGVLQNMSTFSTQLVYNYIWAMRSEQGWLWYRGRYTIGECLYIADLFEQEAIRRHVARF